MSSKNDKRDERSDEGALNLWRAVRDSEADDDLAEVLAMSDKELDGFISANGGDPARIRATGVALAKELSERRARRGDMEKKLGAFQATADAMKAQPRERLPRPELLRRLDLARNDARFAAPVTVLFRQKTAEASTDEELQALLDQIELLAKLEEQK